MKIDFEKALIAAKDNDTEARTYIVDMYRPFLIKESLVNGRLDEDLYQELSELLIKVIKAFPL